MTRTLLVVGTDTGVGKTHVSRALCAHLRHEGRRVVAVKPLETGCASVPSALEDGVLLAQATGQPHPLAALVRLVSPVAPCEAADREGKPLDYQGLLQETRRSGSAAELLLVEGAGGVLSPLTWQTTAMDFGRDLGAELLLVAADRLGTLSHVRASVSVLRAAGLCPIGVVLSAPADADASTGSNAAALARCGLDLPVIAFERDEAAAPAAVRKLAQLLEKQRSC